MTRQLWWSEQGISRFVAGVFEGGGAKGLLYEGALDAMVEVEDGNEPCWFRAVAGASAGAITATLIAAGLQPKQVGKEAAKAHGALRKPTLVNGLRRLRDGASYLDQDSLARWLHRVLRLQIRCLCGERGGETVTFDELYRLTGIELDVVAVDLRRQRLVIFNHKLTPRCQVASAVVASAAIPLAFEWMPLRLPQPPLGMIADGGVMSNFPAFVFKDPSFRQWAGLPALSLPVLGFLLDEDTPARAARPDAYRESFFLPVGFSEFKSLLAAEAQGQAAEDFEPSHRFRPRKPPTGTNVRRTLGRLLQVALWPVWKPLLYWIPALLHRNAGGWDGYWPPPKQPVLRWFVGWFDAVVAGTRPWGVFLGGFLAASLCLGVGAYFVAWRPLANLVGDLINGDVSVIGGVLGFVILVAWSLVPIYAWMVLSIVFLAGSLLHRTVQMTGYGLVKTFLQGPGAPPWAGAAPDDHVVRISVPSGLTTLPDSIDTKELAAAVKEARKATQAQLRKLDCSGKAPNTNAPLPPSRR